ncbi:hypothetical protein LCGC14_1969630, partial [marine sediment metagenome]
MFKKIHGYKTYATAIALVSLGVGALFTPDLSTYVKPSGIAKDVVGCVAIMLGAAVAALRHGQ